VWQFTFNFFFSSVLDFEIFLLFTQSVRNVKKEEKLGRKFNDEENFSRKLHQGIHAHDDISRLCWVQKEFWETFELVTCGAIVAKKISIFLCWLQTQLNILFEVQRVISNKSGNFIYLSYIICLIWWYSSFYFQGFRYNINWIETRRKFTYMKNFHDFFTSPWKHPSSL
jgi:hypothetical protein